MPLDLTSWCFRFLICKIGMIVVTLTGLLWSIYTQFVLVTFKVSFKCVHVCLFPINSMRCSFTVTVYVFEMRIHKWRYTWWSQNCGRAGIWTWISSIKALQITSPVTIYRPPSSQGANLYRTCCPVPRTCIEIVHVLFLVWTFSFIEAWHI